MSKVTKINGVPIADTKVTGFTYDNINTFTITDDNGDSFTSTISNLSSSTINATIFSGNTYYGNGSTLSGIISGATNIGNGVNIYSGVNGSNLEFRTISGASNNKITTTLNGSVVELNIIEPNLTLWPLVVQGNKLISGGATYLSGLTFSVSDLTYIIGETIYTTSASTVVLSSGSTNFDRIDVIYVDISGNTGSVEGTPSASPSKPSLDSATQVEITFVTVPAGSTTPDVTITKVYDENTGTGGGEWDYSATTAVRISGGSTNDAFSGTKSIEFINTINGDSFTMNNPTPYNTSGDNTISFYIKNITDWSNVKEYIDISFRNSDDTTNGNTVRFENGKFGFDASNTTDWQVVSISLGDFAMTTNLVSKVHFQVNKDAGPSSNLDLYIDLIRFQAGAPTTSPQNIWLSFVTDDNNVAVATSSTDQLRFSGGTNITTSMNGKNAIFDLDSNINLSTINATSITATTYYGDGSNLSGISSSDTYVTGGTLLNGVTTFTNNTGGTFDVSGYFSAFTLTAPQGSPQDVSNGQSIVFNSGSGLTASIEGTRSVVYRLDINNTPTEPSPTTGDKLLLYDATSGEHRNIDWNQLPGAGGGEANTASNVGGGNGIFYQKSGVDLQFRSLVAGSNISITSGATTLTINSTASGGGSRITGSTQTTGSTPVELDKIDTIPDNGTSIIEVYVKAYQSGGTNWGVWKRTLTVTKVSGTVTIREENADVDKTSAGLNANSISFAVNSGDIDLDVTGINATTINWESAYEIIL